jgi:hypothetical protein
MQRFFLTLMIATATSGCATIETSPCGANHVLHNQLCWSQSINNGDFKKADAFCQQYGYRLPTINELAPFCSASGGLPNFNRPGADATEFWSTTRDPSSSNTNLITVSPNCRQESSVFLNAKYYFCVKPMPVAPIATN